MDYKYSVDHHFHGLEGFYNLSTKEKFNISEINFGNDNDKNKFQIKFDDKKTKIDDSTTKIFKNAIKSFILNNINHLALYPPTKNLAKDFDIKTFDNKVLIVDMFCVNKKEYVKENIYDDGEKKIVYENKMKYYKSRNDYKFEKYKSKYLSLFNQHGGWLCATCRDNGNRDTNIICRSCGVPNGQGAANMAVANILPHYTALVTQKLNNLAAIIPNVILQTIIQQFTFDNLGNLLRDIIDNISLIHRTPGNFIGGWVAIYDEPDISYLEYFLIYVYIINFIESLGAVDINNIMGRIGLAVVGTPQDRKMRVIAQLWNQYTNTRIDINNFMNIAAEITNLITNNNPTVNFFRIYLDIQLDATGNVNIAALAGNHIYQMFLAALGNPMVDVLNSINNNTLFNNVAIPALINNYANTYNVLSRFDITPFLAVFNLALFQNNTWRNGLLLNHIFDLPYAHNHTSWGMIHIFITLAAKFNTNIWNYNIIQYFHSYLHILDDYNFNSVPGVNNTVEEIATFANIRRVITNYRNRNCIGADAALVDQILYGPPMPHPPLINVTVAIAIAAARGIGAIPGGIAAVDVPPGVNVNVQVECDAAVNTRQRIENALNINRNAFLHRNPAGNIYQDIGQFGGLQIWFVTDDMGRFKFRQNPDFYRLRYIDIYDQYGIPHNTPVGQIRVNNGTGVIHNLVAGINPQDVILRGGVFSVSIGGTGAQLITPHPYIEMVPTTGHPPAAVARLGAAQILAGNLSPCKALPA